MHQKLQQHISLHCIFFFLTIFSAHLSSVHWIFWFLSLAQLVCHFIVLPKSLCFVCFCSVSLFAGVFLGWSQFELSKPADVYYVHIYFTRPSIFVIKDFMGMNKNFLLSYFTLSSHRSCKEIYILHHKTPRYPKHYP